MSSVKPPYREATDKMSNFLQQINMEKEKGNPYPNKLASHNPCSKKNKKTKNNPVKNWS